MMENKLRTSYYDLEADVLYIYLKVTPVGLLKQKELGDGVILDIDEDHTVYGIEILSASKGWDLDKIQTQITGRKKIA